MLLLYLSLYFKTHRQAYYDHLQKVRTEGDWEDWHRFFLTGVMQTAEQATHAAKSILSLFEKDRGKIEKLGGQPGRRCACTNIFRGGRLLPLQVLLGN